MVERDEDDDEFEQTTDITFDQDEYKSLFKTKETEENKRILKNLKRIRMPINRYNPS